MWQHELSRHPKPGLPLIFFATVGPACLFNVLCERPSLNVPKTMRFSAGNLSFAVLALLAAFASVTHAVEVLSLTPSNYAAATAGKIVFIKFFAPVRVYRDRRHGLVGVRYSSEYLSHSVLSLYLYLSRARCLLLLSLLKNSG